MGEGQGCNYIVFRHNVPPMPTTDADQRTAVIGHIDGVREGLGLNVPDLAKAAQCDTRNLRRVLSGEVGASPRLVSSLLVALGHATLAAHKAR